jgi:hypothetical protein
MTKLPLTLLLLLFLNTGLQFAQEELMKIECAVSPRQILQGNEGLLKIRILVRNGVKISANPEFLIRMEEDDNLSFAKMFFTGSELNLPTTQENDGVFLDPQKEIEVPFKLNEGALLGNLAVSGEIVFTMLFPDSWSVKSTQRFSAGFVSRRNYKIRKK